MYPSLSKALHAPQQFVDSVGMYRTVTLALSILVACSVSFGFLGIIAYSGGDQIIALTMALGTALLLNWTTATSSKIPANHESAAITALILFFLVLPGKSVIQNWPLVAAVAIAIMSKFTIVYRKQHLLNPAAVGAAVLGVPGFFVFSWWIGTPAMFIPLLVVGSLVVMKVRKWTPVLWFVGLGASMYLFEATLFDGVSFATINAGIQSYFLSGPALFLAFFMLTEPFTMPPTKKSQAVYGALVGLLANIPLAISHFAMTPDLALVIGNILVAPLRLHQKLYLYLEEKRLVAKDTYEFIFKKPRGFTFSPGQYLEWMLPHKPYDGHGIRRYFTIASSPTESVVRVAMKIVPHGSSYKTALQTLDTNEIVIASQLAGDFVLPKDVSKKLGFIAGGIGVTPFRSHVQFMLDSGKHFDTVLYYCNSMQSEIAYQELFTKAAAAFQFSAINVIGREPVTSPFETGYINSEIIKRRSPDYLERTWYISGPPGMVNSCKNELRSLKVLHKQIKTDFFSGA